MATELDATDLKIQGQPRDHIALYLQCEKLVFYWELVFYQQLAQCKSFSIFGLGACLVFVLPGPSAKSGPRKKLQCLLNKRRES